jgi:hypothetical protein
VELGDETAAPDKDLRQPASGRCSGSGSTRRRSMARLRCYGLWGKERVSGSDQSTRQWVGDSPAWTRARRERLGPMSATVLTHVRRVTPRRVATRWEGSTDK